jgi:hypothetical protein
MDHSRIRANREADIGTACSRDRQNRLPGRVKEIEETALSSIYI